MIKGLHALSLLYLGLFENLDVFACHQKCRKSRRRLPAGACVYPRYPCRRSCGVDVLGDLSIALTSTAAANAPGWPMCAPDARRAHVVVKNTNFDAHWLTASGLFAGVARLGVGRRRTGSSPGPGAVCPYCRCAELGLVFSRSSIRLDRPSPVARPHPSG